ncbi:nitroreductase family protein [Candidatus Gracilibacteria bacterium]|nr:nitroreductase family protein [Candidatus Gracilibacteria bacterium]
METNFLKNFAKRYSCKEFDENKKVSLSDLNEIVEVFRLSPSMLNIQPWKLFIIEDKNLKKSLQTHSLNQEQVGTNSHFLVFARKNHIDDEHIFEVIGQKEKNQVYEGIKGFMDSMSELEKEVWAISQVSVALGNVISFLAEKKIDSCPIGLLKRENYDKVLHLNEKGYSTVFALVIGYAKQEHQTNKKRLEQKYIAEYIN